MLHFHEFSAQSDQKIVVEPNEIQNFDCSTDVMICEIFLLSTICGDHDAKIQVQYKEIDPMNPNNNCNFDLFLIV